MIATDIEPDMIRYLTDRAAREHLSNLHPTLTPAADPQLATGTVDRILVVDAWHHLGDRAAYARALAAALRPGGKLAASTSSSIRRADRLRIIDSRPPRSSRTCVPPG